MVRKQRDASAQFGKSHLPLSKGVGRIVNIPVLKRVVSSSVPTTFTPQHPLASLKRGPKLSLLPTETEPSVILVESTDAKRAHSDV